MATKYFIAPNAWGIFCGMDKTARIDSRTVAEVFGKQHKNVLQAIEKLECSQEFTELNFQPSTYKDKSGKKNPCYTMTSLLKSMHKGGTTMLDRERIEKQEMKACIIAIVITSVVFLGFSVAINMTARCEECGKYVHRWQPAVYTSDGGIHHYSCLEDRYSKGAGK